MQKTDFPSELAIFEDRIPDRYLAKIKAYFLANQEPEETKSLNDWFKSLKTILADEKDIPAEVWALYSKIAWIIADVSYFIDYSEFIENHFKDPLVLGYYSLGITEFIDFERGTELLNEAFNLAESSGDWYALLDLATPYTIILNNSDKKKMITDVLKKIQKIHKDKLNSDPILEHLIEIIRIFTHEKGDSHNEVAIKEIQKVTKAANNHLYSALALSCLASKFNDATCETYQELAIKELRLINARMRLIIALTNAAYFHTSQANFEEASKFSTEALKIADGIPKAKTHGNGLYIYPLFQKAWLLIRRGHLEEALELLQEIKLKARSYKSPHYQAKVNFGLAHVYFLQNQNQIALEHAKESLKIAQSMNNPNALNNYYLEYADLLLDLKEVDKVPQILQQVEIDELKGCSKSYYSYIKGKFELNIFNVGIAKSHLENALSEIKDCENLYANILFTISEAHIHEFRISENASILEKAHEMINTGLERVTDIPNRTKGQFLLAILSCAQGNYDEAEEILENLTETSDETISIPRFNNMAERLLDTIRDTRVGSTSVSPIANVRDVLRYLRDAKTLIEFNPR